MKILVSFSGGKDSQACLIKACNDYGADKVTAVFCDTGIYPTAQEVFNYVNRNDAQLDLFEPEEGYACMSVYHGLCE